MDTRHLAAISLSNRDYPNFQAKLDEASKWLTLAARQGADLAVLPEALNLYRGDGEGNPRRPALEEIALDDWRGACASLIDAAAEAEIALTVPVITRDCEGLSNCFYLVDASGEVLGCYRKMYPTPDELEAGVVPYDEQPLIEWDGLKIGGGICFDTCFDDGLEGQCSVGADLILVPSLWPGGSALEHLARRYSTPIALAYPAWSRILDQTGRAVAEGGHRHETLRFGFGTPVISATINFDRIALYANENQEKIAEVQRAHGCDVRVEFDQTNCTFYLESRSDRLPAHQIVEQFGLMPARDYFAQCRARRDEALRVHLQGHL